VKVVINFKRKCIPSEDFVEWIKKVNIVRNILIFPMWIELSVGRIILERILTL